MENAKDIIIEYLKYLWKEVIYIILTIFYLISLNSLNDVLLSKNLLTFYDILKYNNYKPVWFFLFALVLFIVGSLLIFIRIKCFRYSNRYVVDDYDLKLSQFQEVVANIIAIIVLIILLVFIIIYIQIPILRAIMTAIIVGVATVLAYSN